MSHDIKTVAMAFSGWTDRHITPLPQEECQMTILTSEGEFTGVWKPVQLNRTKEYGEGYLGTIKVPITDPLFLKYWKGRTKTDLTIGFHAWEQNNSEFQYYKLHK